MRLALTSGLVCLAALISGCPDDQQATDTIVGRPPFVSIISPVSTEIYDTTVVEISASDDKGVIKVEVSLNTIVTKTFSTPPYTYVWDVRDSPDSSVHLLSATAYDADGNITTTARGLTFTTFHLQPTGLTVDSVSSNQIVLSWTDNSSRELTFEVEQKVNSGPFELIETVGSDITTTTLLFAFSEGTVVSYRVRALSSNATSQYSNVVTAIAPE